MAAKKKPKAFVLDTNVVLHDATCIRQFQENDIIIPIAVIEEIDHFKRGSQVINLNAREFARTLDGLTGKALFNGGVSLGKGKGKVKVALTKGISEEIKGVFLEDTPDHRILSTALEVTKKNKIYDKVILVTKDVNLRMKAKALGIFAEDYTTDRIKNVEELYSGKELIEDVDDELLNRLYAPPFEVNSDEVFKKIKTEKVPNKFFILRNSLRSVLSYYDPIKNIFTKVDKNYFYGIKPRNAEQTFAIEALINPQIPLVTITGKAGTGKTLLALAASLHVKKNFRQILIAQSGGSP